MQVCAGTVQLTRKVEKALKSTYKHINLRLYDGLSRPEAQTLCNLPAGGGRAAHECGEAVGLLCRLHGVRPGGEGRAAERDATGERACGDDARKR